jgi:hypothetical protein
MIENFSLESWLNERSVVVERTDNAIIFTHFTGERSVLIPRHDTLDHLVVKNSRLECFYRSFSGAVIGNEHIVIASDCVGGIRVESLDLWIPDLIETARMAPVLGLDVGIGEYFMTEAEMMFCYFFANQSAAHFCRLDRDYKKIKEMNNGLESVLEGWWQIVLEDPI